MSRYDEARVRVGDILKEVVGMDEAYELLSTVLKGANYKAIETVTGVPIPEADQYLREEK